MSDLLILDAALLAPTIEAARQSPRRRMNHNLHTGMDAACHRFFNAIEPDSYVMPHRHLAADKDETLLVVRGALVVLRFDDAGTMTDAQVLRAGDAAFGAPFGAHILPGTWHGVVALETGTVFFEAKAGPYRPLGADEVAPWAPREGEPGSIDYLRELRATALAMAQA